MDEKTFKKCTTYLIITFFIGASLIPMVNSGEIINEREYDYELPVSNKEGVRIFLNFPELTYNVLDTAEGKFTMLTLNNEGFMNNIGEPMIPVYRRMIEIPQDADIELRIENAEWYHKNLDDLGLPPKIYPKQPSSEKSLEGIEEIIMNLETYEKDYFIPDENPKVLEIGEIRGRRYAIIEILPVLYNPSNSDLKILNSCDLVAELFESNILKTQTKINRYNSIYHNKLCEKLFLNYGDYDDLTSSRDAEGYLIITYDDFNDEISSFSSWKEDVGFEVTVTKTSEIPGGSSADNIKSYIADAYNSWPIPPAYVLLVGDTNHIPGFTGTGSGTVTDTYYGTIGTDPFSDIFIGRFPGSQGNHINAMVEKTITYEAADFPDNDYVKRAAFMAGNDNYQISEGTHNYVISNYLNPNGFTCDKLYEVSYGATTQDVKDALNDGRGLAIFSGHGSTTSWADGPTFTQSDVNSLTNEDMYPFICSHACVTGKFSVGECFGETWLRTSNKGGLAFWGSSANTYWDEDDILEKKMFEAWWDEDRETIGGMTDRALYHLYQYYGGGGRSQYYLDCYNVLGDPSVEIWRDDPLSADFNYNPSYPNTGETIQFTDDSTGDIAIWSWDFGDGDSSNQRNPSHAYQNEGVYTVTLTVYTSDYKSKSISKPLEVWNNWPPQVVATPDFYAGNNPTVSFDGSGSWDPDGTVVSYLWNFDDGETSTQVSPSHTFSQDGFYDVTLTVVDNGGKSNTGHCEIYIDAFTPPITELILEGTEGEEGWFKGPVVITLHPTDWSGVDYSMYRLNDGIWLVYDKPINVPYNGDHEIYFYSVDIYGNIEEEKTGSFKIDNEKPSLDVDIDGEKSAEWFISDVTITCDASDLHSGLKWVKYQIVDQTNDWEVYTEPIIISGDGSYVVRIFAEDNAGNVIGKTQPYIIKIDENPPLTTAIINGEQNPEGWYQGSVNVTFEAVDSVSGVNSTFYKIDNNQEWEIYDQETPAIISKRGSHQILYYSIDEVGNEEQTKTTEFQIGAPPTIPTIDGPTDGKANEEQTWTVSSTHPEETTLEYYVDWGDGEITDWFGPYSSGEEVEIKHTYTEEKINTFRVKARDQWGGESDWGTFDFSTPKSKNQQGKFLLEIIQYLLERFPILQKLLDLPIIAQILSSVNI